MSVIYEDEMWDLCLFSQLLFSLLSLFVKIWFTNSPSFIGGATDFYMTDNDTIDDNVIGNFMMYLTYITIFVPRVPKSIVCSPNQKRHTGEMSCAHKVQLNFIWEIKRNILST